MNTEEQVLGNLLNTYKECLREQTNRKDLYDRALYAIVTEKSKTKKFSLTIVREIFKDIKKPCWLFLNDYEISIKFLKLFEKGIVENMPYDTFIKELFKLSAAFEFIYNIAKCYYNLIFRNMKDYCGEYMHLFLFKTNFKDQYINKILDNKGINNIKITYNDFIEKIKNKCNGWKDFNTQLKEIFDNYGIQEQLISDKSNDIMPDHKEKSENDKTSESSKNGNGNNEIYESKDEKFNNNNKKKDTKNEIKTDEQKHSELINSEDKKIGDGNKINIEIETIIKPNTVYEYLKNQYYQYHNYKFIPHLKYIYNNNKLKKFNFSDIGYYNKNIFDSLHKINDKTLDDLISEKLIFDKEMGDLKDYGLFCYHLYGYIIEALYSIINPVYLFSYCQIKDLIDDYTNPNEKIQKLYIKSRAMALEYYINISIFYNKYKLRPLPRIIYPLSNKYVESKYPELLNEIEIDGSFFVENDFSIEDQDFPFVFQKFFSISLSNKIYKLVDCTSKVNGKFFENQDLCILEIKTKFPENPQYQINNDSNFIDVLEKMLAKLIIFEQLFSSLKIEYQRIRLILFYDLVKMSNYDGDIKKVFKNFIKYNKDLIYLEKIYFQVIYVDSSYFVHSLQTNEETINNLKDRVNILEKENKELNKKFDKIEKENKELNKKYDKIETEFLEIKKSFHKNKEDGTKLIKKGGME